MLTPSGLETPEGHSRKNQARRGLALLFGVVVHSLIFHRFQPVRRSRPPRRTCGGNHGKIDPKPMPTSSSLYSTIPQFMPDVLFSQGVADPRKTAAFLRFNAGDVATATGVPRKTVHLDAKITEEVRNRLTEIATICALVMEHFDGDLDKTHLWFTTRNPLLGNLSPRELIRFGLYRKVLRFVQEARGQEPPLAA